MAKKIRPIGYVTEGGFIKTAKGWRKAPKGAEPGKVYKVGAIAAPAKAKPPTVKKEAKLPNWSRYKNMSMQDCYNNLIKHKIGLDITAYAGQTSTTRNAVREMTYTINVMKSLGLKNPMNVGLKVQHVTKEKNIRARYSKRINKMTGQVLSRQIIVNDKYRDSFIHEYTHHIALSSPESQRKADYFVGQVRHEMTDASVHMLDTEYRRRGYKSTQITTEMMAQFANQYFFSLFQQKKLPVTTAGGSEEVPLYIPNHIFEKMKPQFEKVFKELAKALHRLVIAMEGVH